VGDTPHACGRAAAPPALRFSLRSVRLSRPSQAESSALVRAADELGGAGGEYGEREILRWLARPSSHPTEAYHPGDDWHPFDVIASRVAVLEG
jgi:hypothetical protein